MEEDIVILALTLFRECRGETAEGKTAVANVIANRVKNKHSTFYAECIRPYQFSSMTAKGDSQLVIWPSLSDSVYIGVKNVAYAAVNGSLPDLTDGSDLYYNPSSIVTGKTFALPDGSKIPFPSTWNAQRVVYKGQFGHHVFMKEV